MEGETVKRMVEKWQIKKIHALKNALKLQDDSYRKLICANYYPCTSSKDLTFSQATHFIENLERMAIDAGVWSRFDGKSQYEDLGKRRNMATPPQLRLIEGLWREVSIVLGAQNRKKALRSWLFGHFGVSDLRFLDDMNVRKVVFALKAMRERRDAKKNEVEKAVCFHDRSSDGF